MMIKVTTLNNSEIYINADLIEMIEKIPDTIITLTTEKKIIVRENVDEIIYRVIEYKRRLYNSQITGLNINDFNN